MLKSTHKPVAASQETSLPEGWTEHQAPTGHKYYHNAATKVSTYTRPQAGASTLAQTHPPADAPNGHTALLPLDRQQSQDFQDVSRQGPQTFTHRRQHRDRPKSKVEIPGCEPWVLVRTRLGRRFVYHPERNQSFWRFPPDVMKGVVELDRHEREKRQKTGHSLEINGEGGKIGVHGSTENLPAQDLPLDKIGEDSESEYEEVEVTDDEDEANEQHGEDPNDPGDAAPVEFDEDDIAYQLQAMGQEYDLDPGEYGDTKIEGDEDDNGLSLTDQDAKALFMDLLNDFNINPYTPWEALIDAGHIIEDDRYVALSTMRSRKEVWAEWSREKIQQIKQQREVETKKDPKIPYFMFLEARATPKLYWPEFRRKYQKEAEMRHNKLNDKDREKWYREYISRLKMPESKLKADFVQLLKSLPLHELNDSVSVEAPPTALLTDLRYISLQKPIRDPLIEAHLHTLPPAPDEADLSPEEVEAIAKERKERERRQAALAERQRQVEEEKRKQQSALRYGKGVLREGEQEVERAMRVGKQGLLGHMDVDNQP